MSEKRFADWQEVICWAAGTKAGEAVDLDVAASGFLKWLFRPGNTLRLPVGSSSKGWEFVLETGPEPALVGIFSRWYNVLPDEDAYGAYKVYGHSFEYSGVMASGLVVFGLGGDARLTLQDRRRVTDGQSLPEEYEIVCVTTDAQRDRLDKEPVVVIVQTSATNYISKMSDSHRLQFLMGLSDGLEMDAARKLFQYLPQQTE